MDQVDLTMGRSFKIWWSYSWRAWVLTMILMVPLQIFMFLFVFRHMPPPGTKADPGTMARTFAGMALAWPVIIFAMVALQAQAMRWMLRKAQWSDFRMAVLPRDP